MVADSAPPDALFRHQVRRLHACGPRPIGELLAEIMGRYPHARPFVERQVEQYAELDLAVLRWLGGTDWFDDRDLIRLVSEGRS